MNVNDGIDRLEREISQPFSRWTGDHNARFCGTGLREPAVPSAHAWTLFPFFVLILMIHMTEEK